MKQRLINLLDGWQTKLEIGSISEAFIRVIYLVLLWNFLRLIPIADMVWGHDHFIMIRNPFSGIDALSMLLHESFFRDHYEWILYPFLLLLVIGITGFHHAITRVAIWFLFVLLHYGNSELSTGGHHLMQELLFFHIFLFRVDEGNSQWKSAGRLFHHLSFYAIWIQIALLYLTAGLWKLKGELWLPGEAMLMTLSHKEFGFEGLSLQMNANTWWLMLGNYISLGYQLFFPILIWIRSIRKGLLFIGLVFHLSISFIVGITEFGLFMVASYAIFLNRGEAARILRILDYPRSLVGLKK